MVKSIFCFTFLLLTQVTFAQKVFRDALLSEEKTLEIQPSIGIDFTTNYFIQELGIELALSALDIDLNEEDEEYSSEVTEPRGISMLSVSTGLGLGYYATRSLKVGLFLSKTLGASVGGEGLVWTI